MPPLWREAGVDRLAGLSPAQRQLALAMVLQEPPQHGRHLQALWAIPLVQRGDTLTTLHSLLRRLRAKKECWPLLADRLLTAGSARQQRLLALLENPSLPPQLPVPTPLSRVKALIDLSELALSRLNADLDLLGHCAITSAKLVQVFPLRPGLLEAHPDLVRGLGNWGIEPLLHAASADGTLPAGSTTISALKLLLHLRCRMRVQDWDSPGSVDQPQSATGMWSQLRGLDPSQLHDLWLLVRAWAPGEPASVDHAQVIWGLLALGRDQYGSLLPTNMGYRAKAWFQGPRLSLGLRAHLCLRVQAVPAPERPGFFLQLAELDSLIDEAEPERYDQTMRLAIERLAAQDADARETAVQDCIACFEHVRAADVRAQAVINLLNMTDDWRALFVQHSRTHLQRRDLAPRQVAYLADPRALKQRDVTSILRGIGEVELPVGGQQVVDRESVQERRLIDDLKVSRSVLEAMHGRRTGDRLDDARIDRAVAAAQKFLRQRHEDAGQDPYWAPLHASALGDDSPLAKARIVMEAPCQGDFDYTSAIARPDHGADGLATRRLCGLVWRTIERHTRRDGDAAQLQREQRQLQHAFVMRLSECIETDGHRVCANGIDKRLSQVLASFYPDVWREPPAQARQCCTVLAYNLQAWCRDTGVPSAAQLLDFARETARICREVLGRDQAQGASLVRQIRDYLRLTYELELEPLPELRPYWPS